MAKAPRNWYLNVCRSSKSGHPILRNRPYDPTMPDIKPKLDCPSRQTIARRKGRITLATVNFK
jgi:hypothetical protein